MEGASENGALTRSVELVSDMSLVRSRWSRLDGDPKRPATRLVVVRLVVVENWESLADATTEEEAEAGADT